MVSQVYHRQLPDPRLSIPAAVLQASSNSSKEDNVLCQVILGFKFSRDISALGISSQFDAYKLDSLRRLQKFQVPRSLLEKEMWNLFIYLSFKERFPLGFQQIRTF